MGRKIARGLGVVLIQAPPGLVITHIQGPDGTRVTWRMEGANDFIGKAVSLVMDMDAMVGGEFAKGLASLETLAETQMTRR